jgi:hypothetical protein
MVSRIRGDDRQSTGQFEALQAGLLFSPGLGRVVALAESTLGTFRDQNRGLPPDDRYYNEYLLASPGQGANVRVDAFPDRLLRGHVRSVAAVASQQDWMSSDVRVYQTLVTIDEEVAGLKPDMSAEVTIQIDPPKEPVLAIPVQAVVGGAENGSKRKVYVQTPAGGTEEREVVTGLFNEKMVEIREGLSDGDQVVLNPKVLLGPGAKTREEAAEQARRPAMGGPGGGKGGEKKGGKGGPPGGMGKGGMPGADGPTGGGGMPGGGALPGGGPRPKQ